MEQPAASLGIHFFVDSGIPHPVLHFYNVFFSYCLLKYEEFFLHPSPIRISDYISCCWNFNFLGRLASIWLSSQDLL
jgi:hypothetical protein